MNRRTFLATNHILPRGAVLAFTWLLTACGGGSGGGVNAPASANADLAALVPSEGLLAPAFGPVTLFYGNAVGHFAASARLIPTAADGGATITVNGQPTASGSASAAIPLAVGINPITVQVTAADGTTQRTYGVFFLRAASADQEAYIKASNTGPFDQFGWCVACSGDTLVVGAPVEDSNATGVDGNQADNSAAQAGAAYVFVRTGTTWSQQAYLKGSNTEAGDSFGVSVAVSGDTVVVSAQQEDSNASGVDGNQADNSTFDAGAVYVFVRAGTTWSQQAYLKASNPELNDYFGSSVAVSGDTVVVGAQQEDSSATGVDGNQADNSAVQAGAAYVFVRTGTTWSQQAYLKASNTEAGDTFGISVAVSDDTVVVGARFEASNATGIDGNQADNSAAGAGAAYVFARTGNTWSQQAYLKASNTEAADAFGFSVAVSGDTVVVGANMERSNATGIDGNQASNSANGAGAAYVFVRTGTNWSQQAYLKASNTEQIDEFGHSVAVSGDTVVVGAQAEASNATGIDGNQSDNSVLLAGAVYVLR